jgi:hypothetical protein
METPGVQEIPILNLDAALDRLARLDAGRLDECSPPTETSR